MIKSRVRANQRISSEKVNHLRNCAKISQGNAHHQEEEGIIKIDVTEGEIEMIGMIGMTEKETETIEIEMTEGIVTEEVEDEVFSLYVFALIIEICFYMKKINKKEKQILVSFL